MLIINANIPHQFNRSTALSPSQLPEKSPGRDQALKARDSYVRNAASAEVIDAEYVESYTPVSNTFALEREQLNLSLEPESFQQSSKDTPGIRLNEKINKYQFKAFDTPPPGTYLNVFA